MNISKTHFVVAPGREGLRADSDRWGEIGRIRIIESGHSGPK